jgi:hypothetical protein
VVTLPRPAPPPDRSLGPRGRGHTLSLVKVQSSANERDTGWDA